MTTFLKSYNVDFEGGSSKVSLLSLDSELGSHDIDPSQVIATTQKRNFLDTLVFADASMNHVATPMNALDKSEPAHRDIVVITTRRMAFRGGDSHPLAPFEEEETSHEQLPCVFGIRSKYLADHYPNLPNSQRRVG